MAAVGEVEDGGISKNMAVDVANGTIQINLILPIPQDIRYSTLTMMRTYRSVLLTIWVRMQPFFQSSAK
jgi:hypothetical protein